MCIPPHGSTRLCVSCLQPAPPRASVQGRDQAGHPLVQRIRAAVDAGDAQGGREAFEEVLRPLEAALARVSAAAPAGGLMPAAPGTLSQSTLGSECREEPCVSRVLHFSTPVPQGEQLAAEAVPPPYAWKLYFACLSAVSAHAHRMSDVLDTMQRLGVPPQVRWGRRGLVGAGPVALLGLLGAWRRSRARQQHAALTVVPVPCAAYSHPHPPAARLLRYRAAPDGPAGQGGPCLHKDSRNEGGATAWSASRFVLACLVVLRCKAGRLRALYLLETTHAASPSCSFIPHLLLPACLPPACAAGAGHEPHAQVLHLRGAGVPGGRPAFPQLRQKVGWAEGPAPAPAHIALHRTRLLAAPLTSPWGPASCERRKPRLRCGVPPLPLTPLLFVSSAGCWMRWCRRGWPSTPPSARSWASSSCTPRAKWRGARAAHAARASSAGRPALHAASAACAMYTRLVTGFCRAPCCTQVPAVHLGGGAAGSPGGAGPPRARLPHGR